MSDDPVCERCGQAFDAHEANVEAWERFDMFVCPECASEALEVLGDDS